MPRMSKKRKQEWALFLNERNRITYNELCRKCSIVIQIFLNAFERRVHIAEHINVREIVFTVLAAVLGALVVGQAAGVKTL